jgi:hypothetical protein
VRHKSFRLIRVTGYELFEHGICGRFPVSFVDGALQKQNSCSDRNEGGTAIIRPSCTSVHGGLFALLGLGGKSPVHNRSLASCTKDMIMCDLEPMEMRLWKSWNPLVNTIFGLEAHWNASATEHRSISIAQDAKTAYHTGLLPQPL